MRFFLWIAIAFFIALGAGLYWKSQGENQGQAAETINASKETVMTNTLIGHWTLDGNNVVWDDSTTEIKDSTVNANHGNALGALARSSAVPGMAGQGVSFNGSTDYMNFGSASSLDDIELQGGGGMTVSVWVKREQDIINENLIGKGYLYGGWYLTFSASQLRFRRYYDTTSINCFSDTGYSDGPWMHVVFTWTGSADMPGGVEFYKNGAVVSKVSCSQDGVGNKPSDGTRSLVAGIYESDLSSDPFLGDMDDIRIYNSVLTATQVADLYRASSAKEISNANHRESLTNGLVGYWTFDGRDTKWSDSTTEIKDISGSGNHGDASGPTTASVVPGKLGQALRFDGVWTTSVAVPASATILELGTGDISISLWVRTDAPLDPNSVITLFEKKPGGVSSEGYGLFWEATNNKRIQLLVADGTSSTYYSSGQISPIVFSEWQYVTCVVDRDDGVSLYRNGTLLKKSGSSVFDGTDITAPSRAVYIGSGDSGYPTDIDDIRFYNRTLSATEVLSLYNLGK